VTSLVVRSVPTPAVTLVSMSGEVDPATAEQFRERMDAVPDRDTVVEMSEVALLCAAGTRVLFDLQDRLAATGALLVLAGVSRPVRASSASPGSTRTC